MIKFQDKNGERKQEIPHFVRNDKAFWSNWVGEGGWPPEPPSPNQLKLKGVSLRIVPAQREE